MATRADHQKLLSRRQIEQAIDRAGEKFMQDLETRVSGASNQPFVNQIRDSIETAGSKGTKTQRADARRALVIKELDKIQKASKTKDGLVDLSVAQKRFGSFASRFLKRLHTEAEGKKQRAARGIQRTSRIEAALPRTRPGGLLPFTSYFKEHAAELPADPDKKLPYDLNISQVRFLFREYWGGPPYMSVDELCQRAVDSGEFPELAKREGDSRKNLFKEYFKKVMYPEFKQSFPWPLATRNAIYGSYLLVDAMLQAPRGTSRAQVIKELDEKFDGRMPDVTAFNNYMNRTWPREEKDMKAQGYPFLIGLPKDETGRIILEAQGDIDPWATDPAGRLALTPALGDEVRKLAFDDRVRYGWDLDRFVDFVKSETGAETFDRQKFQKLRWEMVKVRKIEPDQPGYVPTFVEAQERAKGRLIGEIAQVRAATPGILRKDLVVALNKSLPKEETPYTDRQIEGVLRGVDDQPSFVEAVQSANEEDVLTILDAWKSRESGETQKQVAARLGYDPKKQAGKIDGLFKRARALEPEAFLRVGRATGSFSEVDDRALRHVVDQAPIGAKTSDLYELMRELHPDYLERHPSSSGELSGPVRYRLGIKDWVAYQHTRLAQMLSSVANDHPHLSELSDIIAEARKRHPIAYADETIRTTAYDWRNDRERTPEIAAMLDVNDRFPWESEGRSRPLLTPDNAAFHFTAQYPRRGGPPKIPAKGFEGLNQAQADRIHEAYWQAPPSTMSKDLLAALEDEPLFGGKLRLSQITKLISGFPKSFPWNLQERAVTFNSFLFVDERLRSPPRDNNETVVDRLAKRFGSFPDHTTITGHYATKLWTDEKRFPFVKDLPRDAEGKFDIRGTTEAHDFEVRGKRLSLDDAIADRMRELCFDPRVRYDWDHEQFLKFASKELGVEMTPNRYIYLRREHPLPSRSEMRDHAKRTFSKLIRDLHTGDANHGVPLGTPAEIFDALHDKHGYPKYDHTKLLTKLRAVPADEERGFESGRELIPSFAEQKLDATRQAAQQLLAAIEKLPERKGRYVQAGLSLGYTVNQTRHLLKVIHDMDPEALPGRPDRYSKEEVAMLKDALKQVPVGAGTSELEEILRARNPEFFDDHPNPAWASLLATHLGIDSWRDHMDARLRKLVGHVAGRSKKGVSMTEVYQVMRDEYDLRFCEETVMRRARDWSEAPEAYPELAPARKFDPLDPEVKRFVWEFKKPQASEALAKEVATVMNQHKGKSLDELTEVLLSDPEFAHRYAGFDKYLLAELRADFPEIVPSVTELRSSPEAKKYNAKLEKLAVRIAALAEREGDPRALSVRDLGRRTNATEIDVRLAMKRHSNLFPWSSAASGGNIDIELAAIVGQAIEQADLPERLEHIAERLKKTPGFAERYPSFGLDTIAKLQEQYPRVVPNWSARQQILASQMLVDAILGAKRGTAFEKILGDLQKSHPEHFSSESPEYYLSMWAENPNAHPFVEPLRDPKTGRLDARSLAGRGQAGQPFDSKQRTEASRLAREIPLIPKDMPVVRALAQGIPKTRMQDCEVVCIQHLYGAMVPFMDVLKGLGVSADRASIVGIPYSTNDTVVDVLRDQGWDVRSPPLDMVAQREMIRQAMYQRLDAALAGGRQVVVLDDGGWAAKLLAEDPFLAQHRDLFSIVEQTTRGITVADGTGELDNPLINVAQSILKRLVEGPIIGDVLKDKLMLRLARMGIKSVEGMKIGVVGRGAIGSPLIKELEAMGAIVTGYDKDSGKLTAKEKGMTRESFFGEQNLILGATGMESLGPEELALIGNGTIIGSCSSKLVEIDMADLQSRTVSTELVDGDSRPPTVKYILDDGREITVLASGYPINFNGDVNGIDPQKVQLTRGLMLLGALQAVDTKAAGVRRLDVVGQLELLDQLEKIDMVKQDKKVMESITLARKDLNAALKKGRAKYHRTPRVAPS